MTCENVAEFDFELSKRYYVKVKLHGTPEQFKVFRKSQLHAKMMQSGVKFGFIPVKDENNAHTLAGYDGTGTAESLSFNAILKEIVKNKSEVIQSAYGELYDEDFFVDGENSIGVELVFGE